MFRIGFDVCRVPSQAEHSSREDFCSQTWQESPANAIRGNPLVLSRSRNDIFPEYIGFFDFVAKEPDHLVKREVLLEKTQSGVRSITLICNLQIEIFWSTLDEGEAIDPFDVRRLGCWIFLSKGCEGQKYLCTTLRLKDENAERDDLELDDCFCFYGFYPHICICNVNAVNLFSCHSTLPDTFLPTDPLATAP